jgi:3,4-dihydroxy 2-butanone 4-phosphate synthase/GTP cyclohydrolase II
MKSNNELYISAEEAIKRFRNGEMLILTDHEKRENEGDFVIAAEFATPQAINTMITHGRGLVCVAITPARAKELKLSPQVAENTALHHTAFTVSVDAVEGTTTGISTFDRAVTIQKIIDPNCQPDDLGRPGHVFPLVAQHGGVVVRPGHTEAVVDLAKMAGLYPAGVLCEILDDDGSMARREKLEQLAAELNLKICSVEDLIHYRYCNEMLVERAVDVQLPTEFGDFKLFYYENVYNPKEYHLALVKGEPKTDEATLIRVHSECVTGDIFGSLRCDCGPQLHSALEKIEKEGSGVILYMKQEGRGIGLKNKLHAYKLQEQGLDTVEANLALGFDADLRNYWFAAQMLKDLGISSVRVMTNNPRKINELTKYGIQVVERVPLEIKPNKINERYLQTKATKLGHLLHKQYQEI